MCIAVISLTKQGQASVAKYLPLLQEQFGPHFMALKDWESYQRLSSVQRLTAKMGAEGIDVSPVLASGSVRASAEVVEEVIVAGDENQR